MWSDLYVTVYTSFSSTNGYYGYTSSYSYSDISMPGSITAYGTSSYNTRAIAATGCLDSASLAPAGSSLYFLCAYAEQYAVAASSTDSTKVSTTTTTSISGVLTVSSSASSTAFGSGYAVQSLTTGSYTTTLSGQEYYYEPYFTSSTLVLATASANAKQQGDRRDSVQPGVPVRSGRRGRRQRSAVRGEQRHPVRAAVERRYQPVPIPVVGQQWRRPFARRAVQRRDAHSHHIGRPRGAGLHAHSGVHAAVAAQLPVRHLPGHHGRPHQRPHEHVMPWRKDYSSVEGNMVYFRPFVVSVAGTIVQSLSTYLLPNPNMIVHLRMGLYSLNGNSLATPSWSLLSQTAEQIIANAAGSTISAPLPSAVTLQPGTYAVGVWFDQPVNTYYAYWYSLPGTYNLYQSYTSLSATGTLPTTASPRSSSGAMASAAQTCVPGSSSQTTFFFCAAFPTQYGGSDTTSGLLTALATPYNNSFGQYYLVTGGVASRSSLYNKPSSVCGQHRHPQRAAAVYPQHHRGGSVAGLVRAAAGVRAVQRRAGA